MFGVSCAAPGTCVAVGDYIDTKTDTKTDTYRTLAERLARNTWSVLSSPDPKGASGDSELTAVDCTAPSGCEVVGNVGYNDTLQNVFAYGLSGSTWTAQRQVNPGPTPGDTDNGVSCSAADACTSVGSVYVVQESALVEYWNGSKWVQQTTHAPPNRPDDTLYDVSCVGGASCVAIGASQAVNPHNGHLGPSHVMAEVWNGTSWSQSSPRGAKGATMGLTGISCTSPTACIAVGGTSTPTNENTLIEAYKG